MLLIGFKSTATSKGEPRGIWAIPLGIGVNWKPKAEAKNHGWMGLVATTGIKWEKRFSTRYTFSAGLLWGLFLPDMFMKNKPVDFRILKVIVIPYNLALLLPMTSLQLGYLVSSHWHLSCGLIYLYAAAFNVHYLISSKIALNAKCCLFLDKIFMGHGIHLGFATIGIEWRL
ncbi:hypothetical protein [Cardinium endosymbiont of Philonthus spinipes]|uniref:hypothetical protein n=1 Tax=Cardinium endosymbiont of Philonthus spinipes TaxID=3077941 RepID=UPI00313BEAB7